jgi:hypothetical protein
VRAGPIVRHLTIKAWPFWLTLGGLGTAALLALVGATQANRALLAGAWLQILGLGTVAWGLRDVRRMFRRPTLTTRVREWFRQLHRLLGKPEPIVIRPEPGHLTISVGTPSVSVGLGPNPSLKQRLDFLMGEVDALRARQARELAEVTDRFSRLDAGMATEGADRIGEYSALKQTVEEFAVGGLHLEIVGLVWLGFGVVLGTLPE